MEVRLHDLAIGGLCAADALEALRGNPSGYSGQLEEVRSLIEEAELLVFAPNGTCSGNARGLTRFEAALRLDPEYARAHAGIGASSGRVSNPHLPGAARLCHPSQGSGKSGPGARPGLRPRLGRQGIPSLDPGEGIAEGRIGVDQGSGPASRRPAHPPPGGRVLQDVGPAGRGHRLPGSAGGAGTGAVIRTSAASRHRIVPGGTRRDES